MMQISRKSKRCQGREPQNAERAQIKIDGGNARFGSRSERASLARLNLFKVSLDCAIWHMKMVENNESNDSSSIQNKRAKVHKTS